MDIQYLMRQAKKLEKAMADAKEKLGELSVEAEAGGGLVKVQMNGKFEVTRLAIDAKVLEGLGGAARADAGPAVDPGEKAMLEDLVVAAVNAAVERTRALADEHMAKASGGIKIPGIG